MPDDPTPLQPADPAQGWPRVEARTILGGLALAAYGSARPEAVPHSVISLSHASVAALVRLIARRYPATFGILAREELTPAWRGVLEDAGEEARDA